MMTKRIRKIFSLIFLISVRQGWKLLCNIYNIIESPFGALKKLIIEDKDKSQIFLLGVISLLPIGLYFVARIFFDYLKYGLVINKVGWVFATTMIIQLTLLVYLGYWILKVIGKKHD